MKKVFGWVKKKAVGMVMAAAAVLGIGAVAASGPVTSASAAPVDFTGTTLPFTVPDMLTTATNFVGLYGQWILLVLGVLFAPVLFALAMRLVNAARAKARG